MGQDNLPIMFGPKFKAKPPSGTWNSNTPRISENKPPTPPPLPVWSSEPSPTANRKEFRPVKFESPTLPRKYVRENPGPVTPPPWKTDSNPDLQQKESKKVHIQISSDSNLNKTDTQNRPFGSTSSILQKVRELEEKERAEQHQQQAPQPRPRVVRNTNRFVKPNEFVFSVKNDYLSEPEYDSDRPKIMTQLARVPVEGIGPTTKDGMPIVLRSEVKENKQHEWYKKMFQTLHKAKDGDEVLTIRYKSPKGRYPYKTNGYMSEPEPNYDSDYTTMKYTTLDRRRTPSTGNTQDERNYGTMPNPVKSATVHYKNQPGRIENFMPGHSSVSDKERREWWDEVMEIFNSQWEQQKLSPSYTEGNLSRALKEQGYESDSNLVFRKREDSSQQSPLSPIEQKQCYRNVQAGGEPPLFGFRKKAPEKPKETDVVDDSSISILNHDVSLGDNIESPHRYYESDVNIHYKTPIRYECKDIIPEEELARSQAETMRKLYDEERRRKYIQELQDMNNRRHADNFIQSQKSPIPLNRYDEFNADLPEPIKGPRTVAKALYNFQGQTARELSFKKGETIYIRKQIDKNWYEGDLNGAIGLLPANYVEIIAKDGVRTQPTSTKKPSEGQARAKYNFQAQSGVELSLNKGELVTLTRRVDDNWFEGKIANRKGIFPVSYVDVLTDIGAEDQLMKSTSSSVSHSHITTYQPSLDKLRTSLNNEFNSLTNGHHHPTGILKETKSIHNTDILHVDTDSQPITYRALYKYRPQNNDELDLQEGDIIHVLEKCDDGWYVGTSQRTGCFGTFPGNYVERVHKN